MDSTRKIITVIIILAVGIVSFAFIGSWASNPETYEKSYKSINKTQEYALGLTAGATTTSIALAAVPGDATTPLANKLMDVAGYMGIVSVAVFLEKYMLTLCGALAFKILIPIGCLLLLFGLFLKNSESVEKLKRITGKIVLVGILLWVLVPASIVVADSINKTYQEMNKNQTEDVIDRVTTESNMNINKETTKDNNNATSNTGGFLSDAIYHIKSATKDAAENVGEKTKIAMKKAENLLYKTLEEFAVLIVTTCIIPICVFIVGIWLIKHILGIPIPSLKLSKASQLEHNEGKKD